MNITDLNKSILTFSLLLIISICEMPVNAQDKPEAVSAHYLLPDFVKGSVKMKNGNTQQAIVNYNMLTEEMIFEKGDVKLALDKLETIDTVYLGSRKFIPHEKVFFELLVKDRISLFVEHKCNLMPAGKPAGYGGTSETSATTSVSVLMTSGNIYKLKLPEGYRVTDDTQFWIIKGGSYFRIGSERQFLKIFPEKSQEIELFIKQNKLNIRKMEDLTILISKCNELLR
jgi:hypothetical protein